jgi:hypothetical protein
MPISFGLGLRKWENENNPIVWGIIPLYSREGEREQRKIKCGKRLPSGIAYTIYLRAGGAMCDLLFQA